MNVKNLNPIKWLVLFLLIVSVNVNAKEILPDDIVLQLSTGNLGRAITDVEEFALECTQGTPLATYAQPGFIKKLIPLITRMPKGTVDMQKPLHFFMSNPDTKSYPAFGIILPLVDGPKLLDKMAAESRIKKLKEGCYKIGFYKFLTVTRDGYAVFSDFQLDAERMGSLFKDWKPFKTEKGSTLTVTIDVQKIMRLNAALIEKGKAELKNEMADHAKNDKDLAGLDVALPSMSNQIIDLAEQVNSARLSLTIDKSQFDIQGFISPKKGTEISQLAELYSKHKSDFVNLKKLTGKLPISYSSYYNNQINTLYRSVAMRLLTPIWQVEKVKPYKKIIEKSFDLCSCLNGESATGISFGTGSTFCNSYILAVNDFQKMRATTQDVLARANKSLIQLYSSFDAPVFLKYLYIKDVGKVGPLSYDLLTNSVEMNKKAKKVMTDAKFAKMKSMIKKVVMSCALIPMDDKTVGMSLAKDYDSSISKLVKSCRTGTPDTHQLADLLSKMKYTQASGGGIYVLDLIKGYVLSIDKMAKESGQPQIQVFKNNLPMIRALPSSTTPILITTGATRRNLCMELKIPTKVITEVASAIMQTQMH